jgi:hypothetical protein
LADRHVIFLRERKKRGKMTCASQVVGRKYASTDFATTAGGDAPAPQIGDGIAVTLARATGSDMSDRHHA